MAMHYTPTLSWTFGRSLYIFSLRKQLQPLLGLRVHWTKVVQKVSACLLIYIVRQQNSQLANNYTAYQVNFWVQFKMLALPSKLPMGLEPFSLLLRLTLLK